MAEHEIATALELMQGGLRFEHDRGGWWWKFGDVETPHFPDEYTAVRDFCQWYAQIRVMKDAPQPSAFDVDKFMMNGIEALVLAAAEEMRARGDEFDAEVIAAELARAWHMIAAIKCGLPW